MLLRLHKDDVLVIGYYIGSLLRVISTSLLIPIIVALLYREFGELVNLAIGFGVMQLFAGLLRLLPVQEHLFKTKHAIIVTGLSWIIVSMFGAIPLYLSGHYLSFLDAVFESVSGLTTTGLTTVQDIDHMSMSMNMWRATTELIGGQGVLVAALAIGMFSKNSSAVVTMYNSEGRSERILPTIRETVQFIWKIAFAVIVISTLALTIALSVLGIRFDRAFFSGLWLAISAFDTGGMTPQANGVVYYHSAIPEAVIMVTCLLGVINFTIYAAISRNNRFELRDNIESRTFFFWTTATLLLAVISLSSVPLLFQPEILTRRIVFVVLAAATNSGFNNLYSGQITTLLTSGAIFAVILSMTVGGMSGSTAGGIKSMRLGIIFKSIAHTVHSSLMPGSARHSSHYHHITRRVLDEATVSTAYTITIIFISAMLIGTLVGIMSGYEPLPASFEAVSAATNCGLSSGIVSATMPSAFKVAIVLSMLMGRFEFITIFAVIISLATSLVPKRVFDRFYQLSLKLRGGTSRENRGSHL